MLLWQTERNKCASQFESHLVKASIHGQPPCVISAPHVSSYVGHIAFQKAPAMKNTEFAASAVAV